MMKKMKKTIGGFLAAATLSTSALCTFVMTPEDEAFVRAHPGLPKENHTCSLKNYSPKNQSQEEALTWAHRVMSLEAGIAAGLWFWGDVGVGKTHLAVGIAKALEAQGKKVLFFQEGLDSADMYGPVQKMVDSLPEYDILVLDDINSSRSMRNCFRAILLQFFNQGKQIFLTSNIPYEDFISHVFLISTDQWPRFKDRIESMFKVIHLEGGSQRHAASWMSEFSDEASETEPAGA